MHHFCAEKDCIRLDECTTADSGWKSIRSKLTPTLLDKTHLPFPAKIYLSYIGIHRHLVISVDDDGFPGFSPTAPVPAPVVGPGWVPVLFGYQISFRREFQSSNR